jgi:hypothetical protein
MGPYSLEILHRGYGVREVVYSQGEPSGGMTHMNRRMLFVAVLGGLLLAPELSAQTYECRMSLAVGGWAGICTSEDDEPLGIDIRHGDDVEYAWVGGFYLNDMGPLAFDLDPEAGERGVIRTPFGWLWLDYFRASDETVEIGFAIENEVPPGAADLRIIDRAIEILSDPSVWDREDDRVCEASDETWSLYCAMVAATIDVTGEAQHRQPAMQVVRRVVARVGGSRVVDHRLMDYNNHPDTTFEEILVVLDTARERVAARVSR